MSYLDYMMAASNDFALELNKSECRKDHQEGEPDAAQKAYKTFDWLAPVLTGLFWAGTFLVFMLLMVWMNDWTLDTLSHLSMWAWGWIALMTFVIGRYFGRWWAAVASGIKDLPKEKIVRPYNVMDYGIFTFLFFFLPIFLVLSAFGLLDAKDPSTIVLAVEAFLAYGFVGIFSNGIDAVEEEKNLATMEKEESLSDKIDEVREGEQNLFEKTSLEKLQEFEAMDSATTMNCGGSTGFDLWLDSGSSSLDDWR
ncbi:hypothetical protein D6779_00765 [Candidatus Parcubacteria bacterium]|nr:MAG: hypothetical protein D6779_00765 [Candidatus Parcubacteria bacterium]